MLGLALIGLLGVALVVSIVSDDDDEEAAETGSARAQGTEAADLIEPGDGDNTVFAAAGDDVVLAGAGNDRVFGGDGDDLIAGGPGDDFLRGGAGDDVIQGGRGEDTIFGDAGNDFIDGTDILDVEGLFALTQNALQTGNIPGDADIMALANTANETGEADTLSGGVGDDTIIAGSNDVVITGTGRDEVNLGDWVIPGQPVLISDFDADRDVIVYSYEGDTPPDTVEFSEGDNGGATLVVDGVVVALFQDTDYFDLVNNSAIAVIPFA